MLLGLFALIMIAATVLALNPLRDAVYNESCKYTQCSSQLKLKCINDLCQCYSYEEYTDKCTTLSTYLEPCFILANCFQIYGLTCQSGLCKCTGDYYWNNTYCTNRFTYSQSCSGDQCLPNRQLSCINNKCDCPNTNK